jgi:radical SAM superfamily enzyme YgiQ (UPF0313 family)
MRLFDLSLILIYPSSRDVALASLGFLKVRQMLSRRLRLVDVAYLPEGRRDPGPSPRKHRLVGDATRAEVRSFDIVAFSVAYENDYVQLPRLLMLAGLAPLAESRPNAFPLVMCGGFTMSMNPLPIADFMDAIVVGEGEAVIDGLVEAVAEARQQGLGKQALCQSLSRLAGVYVPALGERPVRRVWSQADEIAPDPETQAKSHFGDMLLVEIGRGCGRGCLFCAAGNLYRPVRMRQAEQVLRNVGAARKVGLVGTAAADHPDLVPMLKRLAEDGRKVGLGSFRADALTTDVAGLLARCGVKTVTLAPEAGSDDLRARIGKRMTRLQLVEAVDTLARAGIARIKLYFMIGLPGETDEDVISIVDLVRALAKVRGRAELGVSVAPFVPKPHTAFQWCGFIDRATFRRRRDILREVSTIRGSSLKVGSYHEAWLEAVLSRGDRSLARALLEAAETGTPPKSVLRRHGVPDIHRALDVQQPLPWDFIESGVSRKGLRDQYLSAVQPSRD